MTKTVPERIKGCAFLLGAFSLAGSSVVAGRVLSGLLGSFTICTVSLLIAVLCLLPFCAKRMVIAIRSINGKQWLMLAVQSVFGIFLFRLFFLQGLQRTSAAQAGILTGAIPAMTALLALIVLKEKASAKTFAGVLSTTAGVLMIHNIMEHGLDLEHAIGNLLVLCAAASESLFNITSRLFQLKSTADSQKPIEPIVQTALVCIMAFIFCLLPSFLERPFAALTLLDVKSWLALVWYGAFVTAAAFICWYAGIKRCSAYTAAAFSGAMPLTAMVLSVSVLDESVLWQQWVGGALVICGMVLIGLKQKHSTRQAAQIAAADY